MNTIIISLLSNTLLSFIKKIPAISNASDTTQSIVLRLVLALVTFTGVVLSAKINGTPVDPMAVQTFVETAVAFFTSHALFDLTKRTFGK